MRIEQRIEDREAFAGQEMARGDALFEDAQHAARVVEEGVARPVRALWRVIFKVERDCELRAEARGDRKGQ